MRKEVLEQTIAEIAKTACCAWEDYARRNRGLAGPAVFAALAKKDWSDVERHVNDGELQLAHTALLRIVSLERGENQAWHTRPAFDAIREYARDQELRVGETC
jgi:hypothetical protein